MEISMHEGRVMKCPVCHEGLTIFNFNGTDVDICTRRQCGIWFDAGETGAVELSDTLEGIDEAFAGEFNPRPVEESMADKERLCPRHGTLLDRYEWNLGSGIVLDRCPSCAGIWMDSGEVEGYAGFVKRFRENPPELTPELHAKLIAARTEAERKFDEALDRVTHSHVGWDLGLVDDMLRGLIKGIIKPFSESRR